LDPQSWEFVKIYRDRISTLAYYFLHFAPPCSIGAWQTDAGPARPLAPRGSMKHIFAIISLISLAACSTPAPEAPTVAAAAAPTDLNCEMTYVTGSALPKKRCETPEEKERQRKLAQETAGQLSRNVIIQDKPGGLK
jgi:hypothetical protein